MRVPGTGSELEVRTIGAGPPVLLVHGSILGAAVTWSHQEPLAERWTLHLVNRPGFGASPPLERGDFELEAPLIAELLGDGAHLVGHSYGAVIALHAAALRPGAVRSLTVSEPGALGVAAGNPVVDTAIEHGNELYRHRHELEPREFLRLFRTGVGSAHPIPDELPESLRRGVELLVHERPPWESQVPLGELARSPFPTLVISGGHSAVFEAVCDSLAAQVGARRELISGRGHSIPGCGEPYNALLEDFLSEAETGWA